LRRHTRYLCGCIAAGTRKISLSLCPLSCAADAQPWYIPPVIQVKGWKVAVVEQGKLVGRTQEWNISRKELDVLAELGILRHELGRPDPPATTRSHSCYPRSKEQLDQAIVTEYNPQRVGFTAGGESYSLDKIRGVLNLGVDPLELIKLVKDKFVGSGGVLLEQRGFTRADVFDDAVSLSLTVRLQP